MIQNSGTPQLPNSTTYHFVYNGHGDVTALTDSTGTVVATYSYDEFGNATSTDNSGIYNPLRYSGAHNSYYDQETGLYKMGARYYQADIGRWLTRDQAKGLSQYPSTYYKYIYVDNNPLTGVDPTGYRRKVLNIKPIQQEKGDWCWAANIQMVLSYKKKGKKPPSQATIVKYIKGKVVNETANIDETRRALKHWGLNSDSNDSGSLSWGDLMNNIDNKSPIMAVESNPLYSHVVLVRGYNTSYQKTKKMVIFNDSADGKGHQMGYKTFSNGNYLSDNIESGWSGSIYNIR